MAFQIGIARHYPALGVEMILMGDDLGMQTVALLGPRIVEEFLRLEYERLFAPCGRRGTLVQFHSCGNVASVVDLFLSLGVDLLDPVQATANDLDSVRRRTQGRMALRGGVGSSIVMEGPAERSRPEVCRRLWRFGRGRRRDAEAGEPFDKGGPTRHTAASAS